MVNWSIDYNGREYPVSPQGIHLGRGKDNEIVVLDDQASRRHALVWDARGVIYVRDEGSTNGTFVNGRRISAPTQLNPGDRIQIGLTAMSLRQAAPIQASNPSVRRVEPARSTRPSGIVIVIGGILALVVILAIGSALIRSNAPSTPTAMVVATIARTSVAQAIATSTPMAIVVTPLPSSSPTRTLLPVLPTLTSIPPTRAPIINFNQRAIMASALILVPVDNPSGYYVSGSGSIVQSRGFILTNHHVVRDEDTNRPYNSQDLIYVFLNSSGTGDSPPDRRFRARLIDSNADLDFALLQITNTFDGGTLPSDLNLTSIPIGNSDDVQIGDPIKVFGYPGAGNIGSKIGDFTVTLTEGVVSGFQDNRQWIKTATEISSGNSGGMAVNAQGELIGIPTLVLSDPRVSGKIGYIRPINFAKTTLDKAK